MDVNYSAGKGSEGSEEHGRENVYHFGKYVNHHNRSMVEMWNVKGAAGKDSEWKYIHVIESLRKGHPYYSSGRKLRGIISCS